jgi:predicted acylesterase/phospholipase RssA
MNELPPADPSLAVSLSSAFLGFYTHAGFLQGLAEGGVWPGHLAGASSGAFVAALAANGWTPKGMLELMLTLRFRTAFMEAGMLIGLPYLPIYERRYSGASKGKRALRYLKEVLGERRVEDSGMDLGIAVTNLTQVRAEVREEGPLAELIVASCAYPTLISHQVVGGDAMWDGGIAQSPPFAHWKGNAEVKRVLAHCVGEPVIPPVKRLGISDAFALAHDVIGEELYQLRLREMEREGKVVTRVVTRTRRPGLFVTERRGREFFENGRQRGWQAVVEMRGVTR